MIADPTPSWNKDNLNILHSITDDIDKRPYLWDANNVTIYDQNTEKTSPISGTFYQVLKQYFDY